MSTSARVDIVKSKLDFGESALYSKFKKDSVAIKTSSDSVVYYTRGANGLIVMPPSDWDPFPYNVKFRDTVVYNPAYLPIVFDGKILPSNLDFRPANVPSSLKQFRLVPEDETLASELKKIQNVQSLRRDYYTNMNNISKVKYSSGAFRNVPKLNQEDVTKRNILHDLIATEEPIKVEPVALPKADVEYRYWLRNGEHKLQLTQNFATTNWHKGDNRSFLVINYHKFTLNYKKDKITFDNMLEWKLNLQQTPADTLHAINISEDLIRLENRLGYKAFDNWSYSAKLESQTQLFSSYPINKNVKNMTFLSPLVVNFGIGMNYSLNKKFKNDKAKKLKLSLNLAPLSFNYVYLNDTEVSKRLGVEVNEGKHSKIEFGSTINADLTFNMNRYMAWTSRFKYFTNYHYGLMEFENKFDMALNRYLSTTIYLYLRFDDNDGAKQEKRLKYFQLNEMLSFGLSYKW